MVKLGMGFVFPLATAIGISAACVVDANGTEDSLSAMTPRATDASRTTFRYDGGPGDGTFEASGTPTIDAGDAAPGTWATGVLGEDESALAMVAMRSVGEDYDYTVVVVPDPVPGAEWEIDPECDEDVCPGVMVVFAMDGVDTATGDRACFLRSGTISITSLTDGRARGAFSGTGSCMPSPGAAAGRFSVSNGSFDVAIGPPIEL